MNAKQELAELLEKNGLQGADIKAAYVQFGDEWYGKQPDMFRLAVGYQRVQLIDFWRFLDREYDNGYGGQELFGMIWFSDGTWAERGEYDGSEWWEYKKTPELPDYLKGDEL